MVLEVEVVVVLVHSYCGKCFGVQGRHHKCKLQRLRVISIFTISSELLTERCSCWCIQTLVGSVIHRELTQIKWDAATTANLLRLHAAGRLAIQIVRTRPWCELHKVLNLLTYTHNNCAKVFKMKAFAIVTSRF